MKVMITVQEAVERGIWVELMEMFGRDAEDDVWPNEEFILTETQARDLGLLGNGDPARPSRPLVRSGAGKDVPPGVDTGIESFRP